MKLAVPLTAAGEAEPLAQAGATEFYCGLQMQPWQTLFGNHDSISRRQGTANLSSLDELRRILDECSSFKAPLFLTLNGNYTEEQLPYVIELADIFERLGGSGVMTMDIPLLSHLKRRNSKLIRGLSILAAVSSRSALSFYERLDIQRVVLPRFLTLPQMKSILDAFPNIQGEALVWLDKCRFIDGYCRFLHSIGYGDAPASLADRSACPKIFTYDTDYRLPACFELYGFPPSSPACAVCSLSALTDSGISVFKMGGRGRSLQTRLTGVKFLKEASAYPDNIQRQEHYRNTFGSPCMQESCYYAKEAAKS